jgi:hypothetical protein
MTTTVLYYCIHKLFSSSFCTTYFWYIYVLSDTFLWQELRDEGTQHKLICLKKIAVLQYNNLYARPANTSIYSGVVELH